MYNYVLFILTNDGMIKNHVIIDNATYIQTIYD